MKVIIRWGAIAMSLSLLGTPYASADPLDSETTKEAAYTSPFEGYVKDEDFEASGWAAANERVGEIGGWRTYLRQAQEPMKDSESSGDNQKLMPHSGHGSGDSSKQGTK